MKLFGRLLCILFATLIFSAPAMAGPLRLKGHVGTSPVVPLPPIQTVPFGALQLVGNGGSDLSYTGGGTLSIVSQTNAGGAVSVFRINSRNMLVHQWGTGGVSTTCNALPGTFSGPYTVNVTDGAYSSVVTVPITSNAFYSREVTSTGGDPYCTVADGATGMVEIFNAFGKSVLATSPTIYLRDGYWQPNLATNGAITLNNTSWPAGVGGTLTVRSEHPDNTVDAHGLPNRMHGAKLTGWNFNIAGTYPWGKVPVVWKDLWFYVNNNNPSAKTFSYSTASGYGGTLDNVRFSPGPLLRTTDFTSTQYGAKSITPLSWVANTGVVSKTITLDRTNLGFAANNFIRVTLDDSNRENPAQYVTGKVTAYNPTTSALTFDITGSAVNIACTNCGPWKVGLWNAVVPVVINTRSRAAWPMVIKNSTIEGLGKGISESEGAVSDSLTIQGNYINLLASDAITLSGQSQLITDNLITNFIDSDGVHQDPTQQAGFTGSVTAGGSGYTPGTYTNAAMTGGTGTGMTRTITVSAGGVVTAVDFVASPNGNVEGSGYTQGDALSSSALGPGTGFVFTTGGNFAGMIYARNVIGTNINVTFKEGQGLFEADSADTAMIINSVANDNVITGAHIYGITNKQFDNPAANNNTIIPVSSLLGQVPRISFETGVNGATAIRNLFSNAIANTNTGSPTFTSNILLGSTSGDLGAAIHYAETGLYSRADFLRMATPYSAGTAAVGDGTFAGALFPACGVNTIGAWNDNTVWNCGDPTWLAAHPPAQ